MEVLALRAAVSLAFPSASRDSQSLRYPVLCVASSPVPHLASAVPPSVRSAVSLSLFELHQRTLSRFFCSSSCFFLTLAVYAA